MSDEKIQTFSGESVSQPDTSPFDEFIVKVNRETNEIIFKDPKTGKERLLKAKLEDDSDIETGRPLTPDQFRNAWEKLKELGITWTTDVPPLPKFISGFKRGSSFVDEYRELQKKYPTFPRELGTVILHTLMHRHKGRKINEKAEIISDLLTQQYRSEFFFKYAIKVPYFEDIDWEVVIKAYERGCQGMPKIAYSLLMLTFRSPVNTTLSVEDAANEEREPEFITVAVNEELVDNLIQKLTTIRAALGKAQQAADLLVDINPKEEEAHGPATT